METHGGNDPAYMFHNTSLFFIVWAELRGFIILKVGLVKELRWKRRVPKELLGDL